MAVNKVVLGSETLLDLTGDTVTRDTLLAGHTAHNAAGEQIEGEYTPPDVFTGASAEADSMDKINGGLVYTGAGTITALVEEKPSSDVVMNWWLRT